MYQNVLGAQSAHLTTCSSWGWVLMTNIFSELNNVSYQLTNAQSTMLLRCVVMFLHFDANSFERAQKAVSCMTPIFQSGFLTQIIIRFYQKQWGILWEIFTRFWNTKKSYVYSLKVTRTSLSFWVTLGLVNIWWLQCRRKCVEIWVLGANSTTCSS